MQFLFTPAMTDLVKWVTSVSLAGMGATSIISQSVPVAQPADISQYIEGGALGILAFVIWWLLQNFSKTQRDIADALRDVEEQVATLLQRIDE